MSDYTLMLELCPFNQDKIAILLAKYLKKVFEKGLFMGN